MSPDCVQATMASDDTQRKILKAAAAEFAEAGYKGARMEAVARRAGLNKALVYRHFRNRENLFVQALAYKIQRRYEVADKMPEGFSDALVYWFRHAAEDKIFLMLLQREALNMIPGPLVEETARCAYYDDQIADLDARTDRGQIDPEFERPFLLLALLSLVSFPAFFPNLTRLVTRHDVNSETFRTRYNATLRLIAKHLGPLSS